MINKLIPLVAILCSAGVAAADDPPATPPVAARSLVIHTPPLSSTGGEPVELEAMLDAPFAETLNARWRAIGETEWKDVPFERSSAGGWYATLPPTPSPGLEYYIRGVDGNGTEVAHFASAAKPHMVRVDPALFDRLEELDKKRQLGLRDQVSLELMGHNFGNRYGLPDRFFRGEAIYTHRLWRQLHHIAFGFGTIWGKTPVSSTFDDHMSGYLNHGSRHGFGEVRVRVHPSVFIDGRVALAVTHDGFNGGVRGQIIFGKPWRSSLFIGGEVLGDLGHTSWVRLQWDTAAPFLMAASIVRTNLPGVVISSAGLYIAYDVTYKVMQRYSVKAQLSYGARDGAAHLGGGLATAVDF
ncbi:MAG: hypothetical protein H0T46_27565 [Deltaproteobacteria bacterium]|nr:hypothetical protein [Deltaproteobacteria bacterium]